VFQQHNLIGRLSALDNVLTGRLEATPTWRVLTGRFAPPTASLRWRASIASACWTKRMCGPTALSGGQQQRVAIARVLAQRGSVLLADEPVASLDPESARQVLATLLGIAREHGIGVLCSLHQVGLARQFARRRDAAARGDAAAVFGEVEAAHA
jgi:phosphonate transport system ATP-binding protein